MNVMALSAGAGISVAGIERDQSRAPTQTPDIDGLFVLASNDYRKIDLLVAELEFGC